MFFKRAKKSEDQSPSVASTTDVATPMSVTTAKAQSAGALEADKLRRVTAAAKLGFKTTADIARSAAEPLEARRVWDGLKSALSTVSKAPAHTLILAPSGCDAVRAVTAHVATLPQAVDASATDWLFVLDEKSQAGWHLLPVPQGQAKRFAAGITAVVVQLRSTLPYLLKGDDLATRRAGIEAGFSAVRDDAFTRLREMAHVQNVAVLTTPMGFAVAPMHEGKVVKPEVLARLPQAMRDEVRRKVESVEAELQSLLADVPSEAGTQIAELNELTADYLRPAIKAGFEGLAKEFSGAPEAMSFLAAAQEDILRRACRDGAAVALPEYCGRVIEAGGKTPVTVEWSAGEGALSEALLRAGKGAVVVDAAHVNGAAQNALRSAVTTRTVSIMPAHDQQIPLAATIILVGTQVTLERLEQDGLDATFGSQLAFAADVARTEENEVALARLLGVAADDKGLLPLDSAAVAQLVAEAARSTGRPDRLSADIAHLMSTVRDAHRIATTANRSTITEADVHAAIAERSSSGKVQPLFATSSSDVSGRVLALGLAAEPVEVWATVRAGQGAAADIARSTSPSIDVASSATAMLWSLIAARFVKTQRLSIAAAIVHEPPITASAAARASAAEAAALLSALAEAPVSSSFAVAGWIAPSGALLPLSGINAAIESAFDQSGGRDATRPLSIVIPRANEADLMLRSDLLDACRKGKLQIFTAADIDETLALITGIKSGATTDAAGEASLNRQIEDRLTAFARNSTSVDNAATRPKATA